MTTSDYPLNCLSDTGDGFSGWFAISNINKCNDFCYWSTATASNDQDYTAYNTADPHQTTVTYFGNVTSYWTCVYDAAGDDVLTSMAVGQRWIDTYSQFMHVNTDDHVTGVAFPYLKCQKGSGEELSTWDGELVKSAMFWECWIVMCACVFLVQLIACVWLCRKSSIRYGMIIGRCSSGDLASNAQDDLEFHSLQLSETAGSEMPSILQDIPRLPPLPTNNRSSRNQEHTTPRCELCTPVTLKLCNTQSARRKWMMALRIVLILALNALLAFTIAFSSISLMEIHNSPHFKDSMRQWTPACSNPDLVCEKGNTDIHLDSIPWTQTQSMSPFSYLIASDAQLNWFNGEFAQMGVQNLPPSCSPSDSCGSCTRKHGRDTNLRLRKGWERLMLGEVDGMEMRNETVHSGGSSRLPVPDTLIMNGNVFAAS